MADTILTLIQIEDLFRKVTSQMLGLNPSSPSSQDVVRISWPADGQPGWKQTEDITFLKINTHDDPVNKQRDVLYSNKDQYNANRKVGYTRVHTVKWTIYGPHSYENAETIRNGLYLPAHKITLAQSNMFLVLDVEAPTRFPELFNGRWWERTDFEARFNEKVIRTGTTPYITTVVPQIVKG